MPQQLHSLDDLESSTHHNWCLKKEFLLNNEIQPSPISQDPIVQMHLAWPWGVEPSQVLVVPATQNENLEGRFWI